MKVCNKDTHLFLLQTIMIRVLIFSYQHQTAWVCWGDSISDTFQIRNGTAQGKCSSPVFWRCYVLPSSPESRTWDLDAPLLASFLVLSSSAMISFFLLLAELADSCSCTNVKNGHQTLESPSPPILIQSRVNRR